MKPFVWKETEEKAFNGLKTTMVIAPVLQLPDFEREFTMTTDASEVSVGAILQQDFGSGLQPICLSKAENWIRLRPAIAPMKRSCWALYG